MINSKRVEKKLPLLITYGPWWTDELDRNEYRLQVFRKREPQRYQQHRDTLLKALGNLKVDVDASINGYGKKKR